MRSIISNPLLVLTCVSAVGCSHRAAIGTDYEFVTQQSFTIDSGHYSATSLYYKGKEIWPCVLMGSDQTYRDGILVFMSKAPDSDGGLDVYEQLFAIRRAGPPIIMSERILNQPFKAGSSHVAGSTYQLESISPISNGVRAVFNRGIIDKSGVDIWVTNDISWPEIQSAVQEAETSAPVQIAPLGNYRILPMKRSNNALEPTATAPSVSTNK
jgi:hypothetical protein